MAADLTPEINAVTNAKGVEDSATVLINGIQAKIDAAVQATIANGATEAQLQPLVDLSTQLQASSDALAAAVAANP